MKTYKYNYFYKITKPLPIKIHNLHIADVYGEIIEKENKLFLSGEQRTGCVFCMFGILQDSERFIRLKNRRKTL